MRRDPSSDDHGVADASGTASADTPRARSRSVLLLGMGWAGIGAGHLVAVTTGPDAGAAVALLATGLVIGSLAAITAGGTLAVAAAQSPLQHVFRFRPGVRTAAALLVVAGAVLVGVLARASFTDVSQSSFPLHSLADLGCVAGAAISVICAGLALAGAVQARGDERRWLHQHRKPTLG